MQSGDAHPTHTTSCTLSPLPALANSSNPSPPPSIYIHVHHQRTAAASPPRPQHGTQSECERRTAFLELISAPSSRMLLISSTFPPLEAVPNCQGGMKHTHEIRNESRFGHHADATRPLDRGGTPGGLGGDGKQSKGRGTFSFSSSLDGAALTSSSFCCCSCSRIDGRHALVLNTLWCSPYVYVRMYECTCDI